MYCSQFWRLESLRRRLTPWSPDEGLLPGSKLAPSCCVLPKALPTNTTTLGIRISAYKFWGFPNIQIIVFSSEPSQESSLRVHSWQCITKYSLLLLLLLLLLLADLCEQFYMPALMTNPICPIKSSQQLSRIGGNMHYFPASHSSKDSVWFKSDSIKGKPALVVWWPEEGLLFSG